MSRRAFPFFFRMSTPYWSCKPPRGLIHSLFALVHTSERFRQVSPPPPPPPTSPSATLAHPFPSFSLLYALLKIFSPITYLRQGIEWLSSECELFTIHTLIGFFVCFFIFCLYFIINYYFFRILIFFRVRGCSEISSEMFRNVPECSGMFHVPDFIHGRLLFLHKERIVKDPETLMKFISHNTNWP